MRFALVCLVLLTGCKGSVSPGANACEDASACGDAGSPNPPNPPPGCPAAAGTADVCGHSCSEAGVDCTYPVGFSAWCAPPASALDASPPPDAGLVWWCGI